MARAARWILAWLAAAAVACVGELATGAGDAGPDAAVSPGERPDAGSRPDAADVEPDGGPVEPDGGPAEPDGGAWDGGAPDAGEPDAGEPDGGEPVAPGPGGVCGTGVPYPWDVDEPPGGPDPLPPALREVAVRSGGELEAALAAARPGDHIVLADGTYSGRFVTSRDGTAAAPIVVRARTPLGARLSSTFEIASDFTSLEGVEARGVPLTVGGFMSRITRCRVQDVTSRRSIAIQERSSYVRVDRCEVVRYHVQGISLVTNAGTEPHHVWIDRNWVHEKLPAPAGVDTNLEEAIQLGEGGSSMEASLDVVVERNLVTDNPDTDDAISIKSCRNVVCGNTLVDARGGIVARGGDGSFIVSNYLVDTALTVNDDDHRVVGNLIVGRAIGVNAGNVPGDSPIATRPTGECEGSPHRPGRRILLAGNSGELLVGRAYNPPCYVYPAEDVRIEAHDGTVTIRRDHSTRVTEAGATAETWEPPRRLEPAEVGPSAP